MATRLYFHAATDSTSGLPTTEQSAIDATNNIDAQSVNRSMNLTIGTSQTVLTQTGTAASARNYYFTKFVSPPLNLASISANTWTYNLASSQSNTQNNFPVTSSNKAVYVNCYVWRPGSSSKVGTILDGNTAATVDEPGANTETCHHVTFSGSSVSNIQNGDVIILEIWFQVLSSGTSGTRTCSFYYDGTIETTTDNATVSDHASFLETPENLFTATYNRAPNAEDISVSEQSLTASIIKSGIPSADSTTITDSSLVRMLSSTRVPNAETNTISDSSLTRTTQALRAPTEDTTTIMEAELTGSIIKVGIPEPDSTTISDSSLVRLLSISRTPDQPETLTISDLSLTGIISVSRTPSMDTVTLDDSTLSRLLSSVRFPNQDTTTLNENVIGEKITVGQFNRTVNDSVTLDDSDLTRSLSSIRFSDPDTISLGETIDAIKSTVFDRTINDTVILSELSLIRALQTFRTLLDITDISEVATPVSNIRSLIENTDALDFSLNRGVLLARALEIESVTVGESIFYTGGLPTGSMTYATPAEVRVLLGNLGGQRTDQQIELAISAAYDEINRKTNRIPPDDWKDTDADFDIIKKLTRYIAAKEMAIGIKDFDTSQMQVEIDKMYETIMEYGIGTPETDIVESNADATYALNPEGIIWSTRYKNLRKGSSSGEGDTTINVDA